MKLRFCFEAASAFTLVAATSLLVFGVPAKPQQSSTQERQMNAQVVPASLIPVSMVVTRDGGNFVAGLGPENFKVEEDGVPQKVLTVDHYDAEDARTANKLDEVLKLIRPNPGIDLKKIQPILLHRRMIVLFFDLTSLTQEELARAVTASASFVKEQMTTSDLAAVVSFRAGLLVDVDFTNNRAFLESGLISMASATSSSSAAISVRSCPPDATYCNEFTSNEPGFETLDTSDRSQAVMLLTSTLSTISGRQSIIYFTGSAHQSEVTVSTLIVDFAKSGLVSFYVVDVGEPTNVPRGAESTKHSAGATRHPKPQDSLSNLAVLARQTDGDLYADVKDFASVFQRVQQDSKEYYLLTCSNSTPKYDGSLRKLSVKLVNVPGAKLTFWPTSFRIPGAEF